MKNITSLNPFSFHIRGFGNTVHAENFIGNSYISVIAIVIYYNIGGSDSQNISVLFFVSQLHFNNEIVVLPSRLDLEEFDYEGEGIVFFVLDSISPNGKMEFIKDTEQNVEFSESTSFSSEIPRRTVEAHKWFEYNVDISVTNYYPISIGYSSATDSNVIHICKDLNIINKLVLSNTFDNYFWIVVEVVHGLFINEEKSVFRIQVLEDQIRLDFIEIEIPTELENEIFKINKYTFINYYPNFSNPETKIYYILSSSRNVTLSGFDILDNNTQTLVNIYQPKGIHEFKFITKDLSSEIYYYKLTSKQKSNKKYFFKNKYEMIFGRYTWIN